MLYYLVCRDMPCALEQGCYGGKTLAPVLKWFHYYSGRPFALHLHDPLGTASIQYLLRSRVVHRNARPRLGENRLKAHKSAVRRSPDKLTSGQSPQRG